MRVIVTTTYGETMAIECDNLDMFDTYALLGSETGGKGIIFPLNTVRKIQYEGAESFEDESESEDYWD